MAEADIEEARNTNLSAYIQSLGYKPQEQNAGGTKIMFLSPLRDEKNASFQVSLYNGRWTWKDWGTGERGDAISFVEAYHGVSFTDAVNMLNNKPLSITNGERVSPDKKPAGFDPYFDPDKEEAKKIGWVRNFYHKRKILRYYFIERFYI